MRIEKLIIRETYPEVNVIRNIKFNLTGINYIVDKNAPEARGTGNSIGKSTVAKIIDLCFSAKAPSSLYTDSETKYRDPQIEEYLNNKKVEVELILVSNFNAKFSLCCSLFPKGYKKINNTKYNETDYLTKLSEIVFGLKEKKPTFKQLISKFVRSNSDLDEHIFKFLTFAPNNVYESVYSYLFKIASDDIVALKTSLKEELANYKKIEDSYKKTKQLQSIELLEQKFLAITKEIEECRIKRDSIKSSPNYEKEINEKKEFLIEYNKIEQQIDALETEISYLNKSIDENRNASYERNTDLLISLYKEASDIIQNVKKSFDELVCFHNSMVNNKLSFLIEIVQQRQNQLDELKKIFIELKKKKREITIDLIDNGFLDEYTLLNNRIEELSISKGEIEKGLNIWKENILNIERIENAIEDLNKTSNETLINDNIKTFNEFFIKYSMMLYDQSYVIAYNKRSDGSFPVRLGNVGGIGTGKKKGLISAFDLAYYSFANKRGITCPQFIVHDKMETMDKKQLKTIFNLVEEIEAQLIVPILNEKIDFLTKEQRTKHIILELSNDDKFFKVN